jgi:hypothetical protein
VTRTLSYLPTDAVTTLAAMRGLYDKIPHGVYEEWFCNLYNGALQYVSDHLPGQQPERPLWVTDKDVWVVGEGNGHMRMTVGLYPDERDVVVVVSWPGNKGHDAAVTHRYKLTKKECMGLAVGSRKVTVKVALYIMDTLIREGK